MVILLGILYIPQQRAEHGNDKLLFRLLLIQSLASMFRDPRSDFAHGFTQGFHCVQLRNWLVR